MNEQRINLYSTNAVYEAQIVCYNYELAVRECAAEWLKDEGIPVVYAAGLDLEDEADMETLKDYAHEYITGCCTGSYWCDRLKAEMALVGNYSIWEWIAEETGSTEEDPECRDCVIRDYYLDQVWREVVEEWKESLM